MQSTCCVCTFAGGTARRRSQPDLRACPPAFAVRPCLAPHRARLLSPPVLQGDARPYAKFLVETTKAQRDAADATELVKDLESYAYYLSALVEKKRLLSNFGGDSVRGITAKERIENTSQRVGLRLPGGSFQSAEAQASMTARPLRPGGQRPVLFLCSLHPLTAWLDRKQTDAEVTARGLE